MENFANAGLFLVVASLVVMAAIFVFDLLTRYKIWSEIANGNMAVAFSTGGITFGTANIMHFAITSNDNLLTTVLWGGVGAAALLIVYFAFELLTPKLKVSEEIGKGNKAVGFLSFIFSLAFSFLIGASVM